MGQEEVLKLGQETTMEAGAMMFLLPGSSMVQATQFIGRLGMDGKPTPAMLAA